MFSPDPFFYNCAPNSGYIVQAHSAPELGGLRFELSHPFAINHPTDEDLSTGTPGSEWMGHRAFWASRGGLDSGRNSLAANRADQDCQVLSFE